MGASGSPGGHRVQSVGQFCSFVPYHRRAKTRMTPLADDTIDLLPINLARTNLGLPGKALRKFIFCLLLPVSLAILCSSASAQERSRVEGSPAILLSEQPVADPTVQPSEKKLRDAQYPDFNREIYYRNKLEFSLDVGWLPINIPFPFDVFEGDPYDLYPLRYTLVPVIASLRWHLNGVGGPWILRGNWDLTFSGSATAIPRGAETRYFSYDMGIRRNFIQRNWRIVPYWDIRLGMGNIDAKGPLGVYYAQGQNFTFTANMGSGVRYNFNPRYAFSAGLNWMHISNNNLSAPQYSNYGINVYGPMFGIDITLPRHRRESDQ